MHKEEFYSLLYRSKFYRILYGFETWSPVLRKEHIESIIEKRALRGIRGPKS
jgi:hypothetical protein